MVANQPTDRARKTARVLLVMYWLALVVGTHFPGPPRVFVPPVVSDKVLHLTAYLGLAFLACLNRSLRRPLGWRQGIALFVLLTVFGALDEVTQIPFDRDCDFFDWVADVTGTAVGIMIFLAASALYRLPAWRTGQA